MRVEEFPTISDLLKIAAGFNLLFRIDLTPENSIESRKKAKHSKKNTVDCSVINNYCISGKRGDIFEDEE